MFSLKFLVFLIKNNFFTRFTFLGYSIFINFETEKFPKLIIQFYSYYYNSKKDFKENVISQLRGPIEGTCEVQEK